MSAMAIDSAELRGASIRASRRLVLPQRAPREALHRLPLGRRAGLVRGRALPGVVGHPQRPHAALGRDRRLGLGVPQPAMNTNGHTVDREGRLVSCEHRGRCVSRTEHRRPPHRAGRPLRRQALQLAERRGRRSPTAASGSPTRATASTRDYEGDASAERDRRLLRLPHRPGQQRASASSPATSCSPTGSPSRPTRRELYIVDTGATHRADGPRHVRRFQGVRRRRLASWRRACSSTCDAGLYDGLRVDAQGHLWLSAGDGVHCLPPTAS